MKRHPPTRSLPERPNLPQLKRQAKELLKTFLAGEADAFAEVNAHYHEADASSFALHDAQLVLARSYGLESWPKLKAFVDGVTAGRLCDAVERGDALAVGDMLRRRPEIVNLERPGHGEYRALHLAVLRPRCGDGPALDGTRGRRPSRDLAAPRSHERAPPGPRAQL